MEHRNLVADYERYNGARLIIRGEVVSSEESSVMWLPAASGESSAPEAMLILFSERLAKATGAKEKQFVKVLRKKQRALVTLEGTFERASAPQWGHLGLCRFRFTIDRVIQLK